MALEMRVTLLGIETEAFKLPLSELSHVPECHAEVSQCHPTAA
jgi:hypothetical protein